MEKIKREINDNVKGQIHILKTNKFSCNYYFTVSRVKSILGLLENSEAYTF